MMNENKKAIEAIQNFQDEYDANGSGYLDNALDIAIKALKRQLSEDYIRLNEPMQVELEGDGYADGEPVYDYGKCPKCDWAFEEGDNDWKEPFCCHCGQKLKWFE